MKIGIISDTHGFFHPRIPEIFAGVKKIIHTGDIGSRKVLEELSKISPLICVAGNHEPEPIPEALADFSIIELAGKKILLTHNLTTMSWEYFKEALKQMNTLPFPSVKLVIFGHTHFPVWEQIRGIYFLNAGYAGADSREGEPTVALLEISKNQISAELIRLNKKMA